VALGLLARRYAGAAMDVSDGFAADLAELCRRSKVGARIDAQRIPTSPALQRHQPSPKRRAQLALQGGEDYELILAIPPARAKTFERACHLRGHPVTHVGELTRQLGIQLLWGEVAFRPPAGFDHFA
jgi:thiamine-monophosphate kinase